MRLVDAVNALGIDVIECLQNLYDGIEISSEADYVAAPDGFYDVLPTGDIVRLIIHISQGDHTRCHDEPSRWHRFHTSKCAAYGPPSRQLKQFKTRRSDGRFTYTIYNSWGEEYDIDARLAGRPLMICGHCYSKLGNLSLLDDEGRPNLRALLAGDLTRRLHLEQIVHDHDRITGFTGEDWSRIAEHVKNKAAWHCSRCAIDLRNMKRFLHAHFKSSRELDGLLGRVVPLCAGCHGLEKDHGPLRFRVRSSDEFLQFRKKFKNHLVFAAS